MDQKIIIFSGMPASGKDTVTEHLCKTVPGFTAFKKHKSVGASDPIKATYYNISPKEFEQKIENGDFLQYHGRYGRYYGIDKKVLADDLKNNLNPIIHIGRIENFYTFCENFPAFRKEYGLDAEICHIQLWETKEALRERIRLRDKTDEEIAKRCEAMEQEFRDSIAMMERGETPFTLVIRNSSMEETCRAILAYDGSGDDGYGAFWEYLRTLGE